MGAERGSGGCLQAAAKQTCSGNLGVGGKLGTGWHMAPLCHPEAKALSEHDFRHKNAQCLPERGLAAGRLQLEGMSHKYNLKFSSAYVIKKEKVKLTLLVYCT